METVRSRLLDGTGATASPAPWISAAKCWKPGSPAAGCNRDEYQSECSSPVTVFQARAVRGAGLTEADEACRSCSGRVRNLYRADAVVAGGQK
jgi:hypothetical protein